MLSVIQQCNQSFSNVISNSVLLSNNYFFLCVCLIGVSFELDDGVPGFSPAGRCGVDLAGDKVSA